MNPLALIPTKIRAVAYAVALLGVLVLGALTAGFAAIEQPQPEWLVFVKAAWLYVVGPAGLALALGNVKTGPSA